MFGNNFEAGFLCSYFQNMDNIILGVGELIRNWTDRDEYILQAKCSNDLGFLWPISAIVFSIVGTDILLANEFTTSEVIPQYFHRISQQLNKL